MFKNKKVFITGGFGFIGASLTKRLLKEGALIYLLKRKEADISRLSEETNKIHLINGTLDETFKLKTDLRRINPDYIFHFASYGGHFSEKSSKEIMRINFWGTYSLLEAVNEISFKALINTGSSSEYGFKKRAMKESDILSPASLYAISKAGATHLVQIYSRNYDKNIITIRPFTVYGPGDSPDKFLPTAIRACLGGNVLNLVPATSRHDYIYIDDLVEGYLKAVLAKGISGEVFNLGTGKQYTNQQIIDYIEKITCKKIKINKGAYQSHSWDSNYWVADITKAKKLLGWKPKVGIEEGIKKTIASYKLGR